MKPTRCPAKEKIMTQEKQKKRGEERKEKVELKTVVSLLNPNFAFCACGRTRSAQPATLLNLRRLVSHKQQIKVNDITVLLTLDVPRVTLCQNVVNLS